MKLDSRRLATIAGSVIASAIEAAIADKRAVSSPAFPSPTNEPRLEPSIEGDLLFLDAAKCEPTSTDLLLPRVRTEKLCELARGEATTCEKRAAVVRGVVEGFDGRQL